MLPALCSVLPRCHEFRNSSASSGNKKNTYHDSYDDGYEDIYYNGDYDVDRYNSDWSYMSGVDDAMEDLGEDW